MSTVERFVLDESAPILPLTVSGEKIMLLFEVIGISIVVVLAFIGLVEVIYRIIGK